MNDKGVYVRSHIGRRTSDIIFLFLLSMLSIYIIKFWLTYLTSRGRQVSDNDCGRSGATVNVEQVQDQWQD